MIGLSFLVAFALWYGLNRTQFGKVLLAVFDREVSMAMGINVTKIFLITFISVHSRRSRRCSPPDYFGSAGWREVIVLAFAVVVIGGMGSIPGPDRNLSLACRVPQLCIFILNSNSS